jgi:hypothetical protein
MTDWQAIVAEHGPKVWRTAYRILADHNDALDCYRKRFFLAAALDTTVSERIDS